LKLSNKVRLQFKHLFQITSLFVIKNKPSVKNSIHKKILLAISCLALLFVLHASAQAAEEEEMVAPNFTLKNLDREEVSLSQFRGKYVLVNFWATWCGPCKVEMPSLEVLYQRFKNKNFALLAISNDMFGSTIVKPFVKANNLNFPILLDQRLKASNAFGVTSLPTTFMIDPEGKIIGALFGAEDWATPSNILYFENLLK
jgi:peroxiredoxin